MITDKTGLVTSLVTGLVITLVTGSFCDNTDMVYGTSWITAIRESVPKSYKCSELVNNK